MASQEDDILLTRPRRMGKSTLVDTLEYLFSKGTVGTEGLYCHEHWPEPNRYFVFHFDWSDIFFQSKEEFEFAFRSNLNHYSKYFGITLATNVTISDCFNSFLYDCLAKLKDEAFLAAHPELKEGDRPFCSDSVVGLSLIAISSFTLIGVTYFSNLKRNLSLLSAQVLITIQNTLALH